jgi:hypothetical protein
VVRPRPVVWPGKTETGDGIVVMTGSDNGTTLSTALVRRAGVVYGWPPVGDLLD